MKPSLLMCHFETKHGDLKHKPLEYFQRKLSTLSASKVQVTSFSGVNMKAVDAFYKVSSRTAKAGKPHITGESLLLPAAKDMASSVLGEKVAKQLESIPLYEDTVSRQISDMVSNVKEQLTEKVRLVNIILFNWMKVLMLATVHLLRFIRLEDEESVKEELWFCKPLLGHTISNDIFKKIRSVYEGCWHRMKNVLEFASMEHVH
jgi:hypothetical protein